MFKYNIIVCGEVQGIGYRYFVVRDAQKLKITGLVRNLSNGDVEVEAEGEKEVLDNFVHTLKTKHSWARIDDIKISEKKITEREYSDFNITF